MRDLVLCTVALAVGSALFLGAFLIVNHFIRGTW